MNERETEFVDLRRIMVKSFASAEVPHLISDLHSEREEVASALRGTPWQSVDLAYLDYHGILYGHGLPYVLTPAALHYYLPALMLACAENPRKADLLVDEMLVCTCTPAISRYPFLLQIMVEITDYGETIELIRGDEGAAIAAFLRYMRAHYRDYLQDCAAIAPVLRYIHAHYPQELWEHPVDRAIAYWASRAEGCQAM
jgi:hypothetical protein